MPLTPDQQALADLMSEISELCYCAGWMDGTEYRLWEFANNASDDGDWGQSSIPQAARSTLKQFADDIGGWIRWEDGTPGKRATGLVFTSTAEWDRRYADARATRRA